MATDRNRPAQCESTDGRRDGHAARPGFGSLARRISAVTTKCLLTAIVLVAGLAFGRQVQRWWAADTAEPDAAAQTLDNSADPTDLHEVQFGDLSWSLRRRSVTGDRHSAMVALRASCREVVRDDSRQCEKPGEAESKLLRRLADREPVEREPGAWRLYELDDLFPMVVGTRPAAGTDLCVAAWGLAIPDGPDAWTVCTFQPAPGRDTGNTVLSAIPLPPECSMTVAVRVASGERTIAFEGPPTSKTWIEFYRQWFRTHNWEAVGDWQQRGTSWYGRYVPPTQDGEQNGGSSVDLHFGPNGRGGAGGLILVAVNGQTHEGTDP